MEQVREVFARWFARAWPAYERRLTQWQAGRIRTTADLLGIPEGEVQRGDIIWCHALHGVPPLDDEAPRFADVEMDGRLRKAVPVR